MTRHPDLWPTAALLTAAVLVVAWATMPARRLYRSSDIDMSGGVPASPMLPRVPVGSASVELTPRQEKVFDLRYPQCEHGGVFIAKWIGHAEKRTRVFYVLPEPCLESRFDT